MGITVHATTCMCYIYIFAYVCNIQAGTLIGTAHEMPICFRRCASIYSINRDEQNVESTTKAARTLVLERAYTHTLIHTYLHTYVHEYARNHYGYEITRSEFLLKIASTTHTASALAAPAVTTTTVATK